MKRQRVMMTYLSLSPKIQFHSLMYSLSFFEDFPHLPWSDEFLPHSVDDLEIYDLDSSHDYRCHHIPFLYFCGDADVLSIGGDEMNGCYLTWWEFPRHLRNLIVIPAKPILKPLCKVCASLQQPKAHL